MLPVPWWMLLVWLLVTRTRAEVLRTDTDVARREVEAVGQNRGGVLVHGTRPCGGRTVSEGKATPTAVLDGRCLPYFWSYNCQRCQEECVTEWSRIFGKRSFVAMQGTGNTYDKGKGERRLQQRTIGEHDVWESRVAKRKGPGSQPEGVAIWAPRGWNRIARAVYVPSDVSMEGRAMAVRFHDGLMDVMIVSVYCHVGSRDVGLQRKTERIWQWCRQLRSKVPVRTQVIIGVDANGHVGSVRHKESQEENGSRDQADYVHIGTHNIEEENPNGMFLREFLEGEQMVAVNTYVHDAPGWTWSHLDQHGDRRTRVDYVLVDIRMF